MIEPIKAWVVRLTHPDGRTTYRLSKSGRKTETVPNVYLVRRYAEEDAAEEMTAIGVGTTITVVPVTVTIEPRKGKSP